MKRSVQEDAELQEESLSTESLHTDKLVGVKRVKYTGQFYKIPRPTANSLCFMPLISSTKIQLRIYIFSVCQKGK